jgi:hypothetical protein
MNASKPNWGVVEGRKDTNIQSILILLQKSKVIKQCFISELMDILKNEHLGKKNFPKDCSFRNLTETQLSPLSDI